MASTTEAYCTTAFIQSIEQQEKKEAIFEKSAKRHSRIPSKYAGSRKEKEGTGQPAAARESNSVYTIVNKSDDDTPPQDQINDILDEETE